MTDLAAPWIESIRYWRCYLPYAQTPEQWKELKRKIASCNEMVRYYRKQAQ